MVKEHVTTESPKRELQKKLFGLIAEFETTTELLTAAKKVREEGFRHWDTHTPIPIHGLDHAMGIRKTILPKVVLICGITGGLTGLWMQWWMNAVDYPWIVSGKPFWSLPANIPVIFELTILLAAFGAVFGMLGLNKLPSLYHALFESPRFVRGHTDDKFYISIEAKDDKFSLGKTKSFLESLGAAAVEEVHEPETPPLPPVIRQVQLVGGILLVLLALVPPALLARASSRSQQTTRVQLIPNMDQQPKFVAQETNNLFLDGRAMRPHVSGTVARGEANLDTAFYRGMDGDEWAAAIPMTVDLPLVERGQQRFTIYCAQCHGYDGSGRGPVAIRAEELQEGTWVPPTSLHDQLVRDRPDGHIFNTISNGIRNMPPYGDQIDVQDRWAIVAYVRALQKSQSASLEDVPVERRGDLK
jgi:mono/diheme cytochrome c family protein